MNKIKCDEVHPACGQCVKRGFDCVYDPGAAAKVDINSTLARRRSRAACTSCRTLKRRCSAAEGDDRICSRCKRLGLQCEWQPSKTRRPRTVKHDRDDSDSDESVDNGSTYDMGDVSLSPRSRPRDEAVSPKTGGRNEIISPNPRPRKLPSLHRSPFESLMANKAELHMLVRGYFGTVHQFGFLAFIHEPSFFRLLERGKAPMNLTKLMVALALRFAGDNTTATLRRADLIYEEVFPVLRDQLYEGFGAIELMCVLLAREYDHARGNFYASWMMWGNAVRIMQFLSLHTFDETYPQPHAIKLNPLLKPEALRRLAWSVFYLDTMADAGRHGIHTVTETGFHLQLPADEASFLRGVDVVTMPLEKHPSARSHSVHMPWESPVERGGSANGNITPASSTMSIGAPAMPQNAVPGSATSNFGIGANIIRTAAMRRRILHFNSLLKYSLATPQQMYSSLGMLERDLRAVINDLPPDLAYSEDALFVHAERRTMFILLHMMRHNCFLMLLWAKLNVASRSPDPPESTQSLMQERMKHAFGVAGIVSDAVRLGVNCDPFVAVQAYTSLEVLLFDPLRLLRFDPTIQPKHPRFARALLPLLELMRRLSPIDLMMRYLRVEACRRLARCGFGDILIHADWQACKLHPTTGQTDSEFDFRFFKWHRVEQARQSRHSLGTSQAAEALLDLGSLTANPSRTASPDPDGLETGNVFGPEDYALPPDFEDSLRKSLSHSGQVNSTSPHESLGSAGLASQPFYSPNRGPGMGPSGPSSNMPVLPQHPGVQAVPSLHPSNATTGVTHSGSSGLTPDVRRWVDLDYQPRPILPSTGLEQIPFGMSENLGLVSNGMIGTPGGDDLNRFLEQAGYAEQEADPFGWLGLVDGDNKGLV
ncbi:hypothetical protein BD324DRAFT_639956 [Kockovaella imperatae]|uniref:Zn(2)-C6 fungal-type domain-containing protein n=1 Tax=Kockovaella imperatae TaxID=4999 RepID=A0A1Y1U8F0_9TREE|nr:hypothetical protein BD324DRAFT_639956 [Kockovaella imperatae]ORX33395.1 hypothetical protein BD324DRAFT_639956 [Kockovaella imperatae]